MDLYKYSNLNEASNDLNLTACSQGGTVRDAHNVGAVHENAKNAINQNAINKNAIGILIASAIVILAAGIWTKAAGRMCTCVMVEMTGGHMWTRAAGAMNTRAAASGNMTGFGHMKAAAERIVIVFRGILMAEIV